MHHIRAIIILSILTLSTPNAATAGAGPGSMQRIAAITVENLRRYLAGERLLNIVDMRAGY